MTALVSTIDVDAPPEQVYALATDPRRFPEWQRDVVAVRLLDGGRFETTRSFAGAKNTLLQEVTRADPPRKWAAQGVAGVIRAHACVAVEPLDGAVRSRVTFTLDFEASGMGAALLPLVRRQAAKAAPLSYRRLKQLLETA